MRALVEDLRRRAGSSSSRSRSTRRTPTLGAAVLRGRARSRSAIDEVVVLAARRRRRLAPGELSAFGASPPRRRSLRGLRFEVALARELVHERPAILAHMSPDLRRPRRAPRAPVAACPLPALVHALQRAGAALAGAPSASSTRS